MRRCSDKSTARNCWSSICCAFMFVAPVIRGLGGRPIHLHESHRSQHFSLASSHLVAVSARFFETRRHYLDDEGFDKLRRVAGPFRIRRPDMAKLTDYVKTAEAAEILGVAQNTIRKWAEQGKIPMRRNPANGYRLFKRKDLERFLMKIEAPSKRRGAT